MIRRALTCLVVVALSILYLQSNQGIANHYLNGSYFSTSPSQATNVGDYYQRIEMDKAWQISTGSSSVSVGIIDTGFVPTDPRLQGNIDTSLSYDFCDQNRGPFSNINLYHGTEVASRLGGNGNSGLYSSGVVKESNLIALRVDDINSPHNENLLAVAYALFYAQMYNVPIVNFSGGFYESDIDFISKNILQAAVNQYSGLIVCAAGNGNENTSNPEMYNIDSDEHKLYPACFTNDNILVVGGTMENSDELNNGKTNYGTTSVDLFAPGGDGTSLATPLVAGTAALMLSVNPNLTTVQLKQKILSNVDYIQGYENYCVSHGRLNVLKSLLAALPAIGEGTTTSLNQIEYGSFQWYRFISGYGIYSFETTGSLDTVGSLYYNNLSGLIETSSSGGSGNNFSFTCPLSPGAYYLKIGLNSYSLPGYYNITISNHPHLYNDHYSSAGFSGHKCYCLCGDYEIKPHVFPTDINGNRLPCVVCGFSLGGGILSIENGAFFGNGSFVYEDGTICLSHDDYIWIMHSDFFNGVETWNGLLDFLL